MGLERIKVNQWCSAIRCDDSEKNICIQFQALEVLRIFNNDTDMRECDATRLIHTVMRLIRVALSSTSFSMYTAKGVPSMGSMKSSLLTLALLKDWSGGSWISSCGP